MPTVRVIDINIYYEIHGQGEPLVMIAGYGDDSSIWFRQVPGLSKEYEVIIFDNRGTGRSSKPDALYTIRMMADDLAGLMDAIGIQVAHIYGHSTGGMIAQEFALCYPKKVKTLILACTVAPGAPVVLADDEVNALVFDFDAIDEINPQERIRRVLPVSFSQGFIDSHPDIIEEFITRRSEYPTPRIGLIRQLEALITANTYDRLPQISVPTLIICAAQDKLNPVENQRTLASQMPNAELVVMENLGHGLYLEGVEQVNGVIVDFLRRHPKSC